MPGAVIGGSVVTYLEIVADADLTAWMAAVVDNGGSVSAGRQALVSALIVGLKDDGVWTKLDRLWVFAAENQPSALTDMVARDLATAVSSPSFTADDGFSGNGSSSYIDSTYNPATAGVNFTLNAASMGAWLFTADTTFPHIMIGANDSSNLSQIVGSANFQLSINQFGGGLNGAWSAAAGLYHGTRTNSTTLNFYFNGGDKQSNASSSTGIPSLNQYFLCENGAGSPLNYSTNQLSAVFYGGSMTDADVSNFYNRMRTYMTAVGVP